MTFDGTALEDKDVDALTSSLDVLEIKEGFSKEYVKVAEWITSSSNILILSGAGVSCSAGIPDFRTPGTGLYDNLQKYNLPFPEAVFDLGFYQENPTPFCQLAKEIWPGVKHSPTPTHAFCKLLSKEKKLLRNYTQNIDGLEFLAHIDPEEIVECHGHFRTSSCTSCSAPFDGEKSKQIILKEGKPPICDSCGGYVKPDIVFFGEGLPDRFGRLLTRDLHKVDLLIVMGTSLSVAPVSMIPEMVDKSCKRVLINRDLVGNIRQKHRDVWLRGDCDDSVEKLCKLLQWEEQLKEWTLRIKIGFEDEREGDKEESNETENGKEAENEPKEVGK